MFDVFKRQFIFQINFIFFEKMPCLPNLWRRLRRLFGVGNPEQDREGPDVEEDLPSLSSSAYSRMDMKLDLLRQWFYGPNYRLEGPERPSGREIIRVLRREGWGELLRG